MLLLLQYRWYDQFRSHQSQILKCLCSIHAARFTEHGQQHWLLHALHKLRDIVVGETVAIGDRRNPAGLLVALAMQPSHDACW